MIHQLKGERNHQEQFKFKFTQEINQKLPLILTVSALIPSEITIPVDKQETVGRGGLAGHDICTCAPIIIRGRI